MRMTVHQAGNDAPSAEVYDLRFRSGELHDLLLVAHRGETVIGNGNRAGIGLRAIQRREFSVPQYEHRGLRWLRARRVAEERIRRSRRACLENVPALPVRVHLVSLPVRSVTS